MIYKKYVKVLRELQAKVTLFGNYSKCRICLILAFSTNFCPNKTDMSGNTVWPQASGYQKLAKMDHFWHFWLTFVHSKCKRSSLRSQCWMRLFLWFSNTVQRSGGGRNHKNPVGRTQSQEVSDMGENQSYSPFSAILNIVGVTTNPPLSAAGWVVFLSIWKFIDCQSVHREIVNKKIRVEKI